MTHRVSMIINRDESLRLVRLHVSKENNVKHMIAVGAAMKRVALRLGEDHEKWEIVGILHDIDFEICSGPADHTIKAEEMLLETVDREVVEAIQAHNYENTKVPVDTTLKKALLACDAVSGLVIACALVMPSKSLAEVRPETVMKKHNSKDFARNVNRDRIAMCGGLGITLEEFLSLSLEGMKAVSNELGL